MRTTHTHTPAEEEEEEEEEGGLRWVERDYKRWHNSSLTWL